MANARKISTETLPEREYYRLNEVAEKLTAQKKISVTEADILCFGVESQIPICIMLKSQKMKVIENSPSLENKPRLEAPIRLYTEIWKAVDGGRHKYFNPEHFPQNDESIVIVNGLVQLSQDSLMGVDFFGEIEIPYCLYYSHNFHGLCALEFTEGLKKITKQMLILPRRGYEILRDYGTPNAKTYTPPRAMETQRQPHRNSEINATIREKVLKSAIALKEAFPEQCKGGAAWAKLIDEKAPLFWPDDGKPPLSLDVITRLLNAALKLPD